eukprot:2864971-Pyramimonas_sp.AAC.1
MPLGVSLAYVLNTLGKHGEELEAYKTARFAYNKLQGLKMPAAWHDEIDLACVMTRAKPFSDKVTPSRPPQDPFWTPSRPPPD